MPIDDIGAWENGPRFNPAKPFYPIVSYYKVIFEGMRYLVDLAGHFEAEIRNGVTPESIMDMENTGELPRLMFHSQITGGRIAYSTLDLMADLMLPGSPVQLTVTLAASMLIHCHEITRHLGHQEPEWEFLRHCRNAAAHGGRFNILGAEPRRPASWRGKTIEIELNGERLMDNFDHHGFLSAGDPILLLWDLEQFLPETT